MHWTERRTRFRALLAGDRCIHPGSVFDPISARIAEDLGFEIGMFAGSAVTWLNQGKHRKRARNEAREAVRWQSEADRHKTRAEEVVGQLPSR